MNRTQKRLLRTLGGEIYLGVKEGGGDHFIPRSALDTHAHFIGPTKSGKTRALQLVAQQLIDAGDCSVVVIDPHDGRAPTGGLYHALKSHCYRNDHADRLVTIDPLDYREHRFVAGFNPLARGADPSVQAGLGVELLRSVLSGGDPAQSFASAPMLSRWAFNTFLGLIENDLPMADVGHVLRLDDPSYRRGFAELLASDYPDVASDWRWLASFGDSDRARQVIDDKLGSTTNRLRAYTETRALRYMLSTRRRTVDLTSVMDRGQIVLANLNPRGLMLELDQRMLGTQLVHAVCRAAMDRNDPDGRPCYLVVDEFQKFLTPEVLEILDGTRKFGLHLILAHQYLAQLQNAAAQDWRYYHSVLTNARLRVVFGGAGVSDAEALASHMYGAHLDPMRVKQEIYRTVQLAHQEWVEILGETEASSRGRGRGRTSSEGRSDGTGRGLSRTERDDPFEGLPSVANTFSDAYLAVLARATSEGSFDSESEGRSRSRSVVPVTVPGDPFQELSSREFMGLEEQLYVHTARMRRLPAQEAVFQIHQDYPVRFRVADVPDPDYEMAEVVPLDRERLKSASWAVAVDDADEEARERDASFRRALAAPRSGAESLPSAEEQQRNLTASRALRSSKPKKRATTRAKST